MKRLSKLKKTFLCIIFVVIFSGLLIVTLIISGLKYWNQAEDDLVKTPRKDVPGKLQSLFIRFSFSRSSLLYIDYIRLAYCIAGE